MATITVTIGGGGHTAGRTRQISGTDLQQRVLPALRKRYTVVSSPPVTPPPPDLTDDQCVEAWADDVIAQLQYLTRHGEQVDAAKQAADNVPPIEVTP